jgi:hypothetical protein
MLFARFVVKKFHHAGFFEHFTSFAIQTFHQPIPITEPQAPILGTISSRKVITPKTSHLTQPYEGLLHPLPKPDR